MIDYNEIGNEPADHHHRPYLWLGEDADAHVTVFKAVCDAERQFAKRAPSLADARTYYAQMAAQSQQEQLAALYQLSNDPAASRTAIQMQMASLQSSGSVAGMLSGFFIHSRWGWISWI